MRVWVTRALPEAEATAARLREAGHEPLVAPLLAVEPLPAAVDMDGVAALAFTSANGVRAFAALSAARAMPVFAVGAATAAVARAAGFAAVSTAHGDVAALAAAIAAEAPRLEGTVLHLAAAEPAGDLIGDLRRRGVAARALAVYRTVAQPTSPEVFAALDAGALGAVLLQSPKAARLLAHALAGHPAAAALSAVALAPAVAAPLAGLGLAAVAVASAPTEAALLAALAALPRRA